MGCISNPEVTHSLLTILIVLLVALMFILLYFNRRKVQDNVKPLIDNFQRSMQYKTIEKVSLFLYEELSYCVNAIETLDRSKRYYNFYIIVGQ